MNQNKQKENDDEYKREYDSCIKSFRVEKDQGHAKYVRCEICLEFLEIVRRGCKSSKPPTITTENGIRFRKQTIVEHFASIYHGECKQAHLLASTKGNPAIHN